MGKGRKLKGRFFFPNVWNIALIREGFLWLMVEYSLHCVKPSRVIFKTTRSADNSISWTN